MLPSDSDEEMLEKEERENTVKPLPERKGSKKKRVDSSSEEEEQEEDEEKADEEAKKKGAKWGSKTSKGAKSDAVETIEDSKRTKYLKQEFGYFKKGSYVRIELSVEKRYSARF